jgi:hypothetical protein
LSGRAAVTRYVRRSRRLTRPAMGRSGLRGVTTFGMTRTDGMGYELSQDEGRIVDAIAALEASGRPTYVDDITAEAGLPRETVRWLLRRLLRETNLVHEVVPEAGPDLGPYYEIAPKD